MGDAKHTPGPWTVDENTLAGYGDNGSNFYVVAPNQDRHDGSIATLPMQHRLLDYGATPEYECAKANARLIAAAPELLEACKLFVEAIDGCAYPAEDAGLVIAAPMDAIRAAIAKAEGTSE